MFFKNISRSPFSYGGSIRYADNGRIAIDNSAGERALGGAALWAKAITCLPAPTAMANALPPCMG
jgi:hypothetical protein